MSKRTIRKMGVDWWAVDEDEREIAQYNGPRAESLARDLADAPALREACRAALDFFDAISTDSKEVPIARQLRAALSGGAS